MRRCLFICLSVLIGVSRLTDLEATGDFIDFCFECIKEEDDFVRVDHIPDRVSCNEDDTYLTGYVQSLLDMHYCDFRTIVVVLEKKAYLFNLPKDTRSSLDVVNFVRELPFISEVICEISSYENFIKTQPDFVKTRPDLKSPESMCTCQQSFKPSFPFCCCKKGIWFPQNTVLFAPLVADPHQVTNGACLRFDDEAIGNHVGATFFGGDFIFLRVMNVGHWKGDMDFGIQAGIFSVFDLDHPEGCLVNSDFFVSFLSSYAINKWSWRFRLWHLSSHLGDEFIVANPGFPRLNPSDEGVDAFVSYRINRCLRLYGGLGYIFSRDRTFPEQPFYFELGSELRPFGLRDKEKNLYAQPIFAMHLRFWEEQNFVSDQTYILGMEWGRFMDVGRMIRAFFEYHHGFSKEGQFIRDRSSYYGFKVTYGF
ncbi:MAG: DUF1207 domain-containing protein [Victivallaceae bacterium]